SGSRKQPPRNTPDRENLCGKIHDGQQFAAENSEKQKNQRFSAACEAASESGQVMAELKLRPPNPAAELCQGLAAATKRPPKIRKWPGGNGAKHTKFAERSLVMIENKGRLKCSNLAFKSYLQAGERC
ncbi:MAG TPA: hypothetical protein VGX94_09925, partial [Terriglobia bacterium]|nr:hypothetical protein [Terriglobia bacterium]